MKGILLIITFFLCTKVHARCYQFELTGESVIEGDQIIFILAQGTQSEVKIPIPNKEQDLFGPYINSWATTKVVLDRDYVNYNTKLLKALSIQYSAPDPLNLTSKKSIKRIGAIKCPKK